MTEHYIADKKCADWVLSRWYYIVQPSTFWKRNSLRLDENYHYAFDWKYFIEMFREYNYMFLHEDMAVYRMYEDNKTGQDNAKRKKEIYELQNEVNPGSLNAKWCKHVWKRYEKAEKLGKTGMKKRSDLFSRILFHITGKRICSF